MPTLTGFSTKQLEMMCELELDPSQPGYAHAKAIQTKISLKLARLYHIDTHFGSNPHKKHKSHKHWLNRKHGIVQSREKAEKYAKLAGLVLPPLSVEQKTQEDEEGFAIIVKIKNYLCWFTSVRLFLVRANRLALRFKDAFIQRIPRLSPALKFVPRIFPIFSLSYIFEAIFGSVEILKATQKPLSDHEIGMSNSRRNLQRIYNAAFNVPSISYMANAIVWFPINLISIKFTGGLFFVITNLVGFSFDVVNEAFKGSDTLWHGFRGLAKINKLLKTPSKDSEKEAWQLLHGALKKDVRRTFWQTSYSVLMTAAILVGMGMIFVPHTMPIGVGLLGGSILALGGGSVFLGFGRRVAMATLNFTKTHLLGMSNKNPTPENKLRTRAKLMREEPSIFAAFNTHAQLQQSLSQRADRKNMSQKVTYPKFRRYAEYVRPSQLASAHTLFPSQKRITPTPPCTKVASNRLNSPRRTQT